MSQQQPDIKQAVNNLINQIMSSPNPQATFQQMLNNNKEAKAAYDNVLKYGNGDPKVGLMNYVAQTGQQNALQQLMNLFGMN